MISAATKKSVSTPWDIKHLPQNIVVTTYWDDGASDAQRGAVSQARCPRHMMFPIHLHGFANELGSLPVDLFCIVPEGIVNGLRYIDCNGFHTLK